MNSSIELKFSYINDYNYHKYVNLLRSYVATYTDLHTPA